MKANLSHPLSHPRALFALASVLMATGCATAPTPAPPPPPAPIAAAPRPAPAPPQDWRDAPLSPGEWRYHAAQARFGGSVVLACTGAGGARSVTLSLLRDPGAPPIAADAPVTITTSEAQRQIGAAGPDAILTIAPRDPILDAMVFSRGRFMIEVAGQAPLILPARPEVARVIEDCR